MKGYETRGTLHWEGAARARLPGISRIALGAALMLAAVPAVAQESAAQAADTAAPAGQQIEDIVVTARYRAESLQDTPIAITALSGGQLERRGITSVLDVARFSPNVTLTQSAAQGGKSAVAIIRGVGQTDFSFALEPGVGFYIDDVYQATAFGSIFELGDTDRVEVLRGPQGTLFGKNNEGGAIRVYTTRAKGDNSGYVELGYGNYNRFQGRAAVDVPLVDDQLFLRVSGGFLHTDGFQDRIDYACANPDSAGSLPALVLKQGCKLGTLGGKDIRTARANLRWMPAHNLEINLIGDILDDQGQAPADSLMIVDPNTPGSLLTAYNEQYVIPRFGIPIDQRFITGQWNKTYTSYNEPITGLSNEAKSTVRSWGVTGIVDWKIGDALRLKSVTAYRHSHGEGVLYQPLPIPPAPADNVLIHRQFSQELDLSGTVPVIGRDLDWTVGGYYFDGRSINRGLIALPGFAPIFGFFYAFQPDDPANDTNKSVFAHAVYNISDSLSLEGGLRYSKEDKDYTFSRLLVPQNELQYPVTRVETSSDRVDYKAGIQYKITPSAMVYGSFSTGYKAGGFNPRPLGPEQITAFDPEELTAYEVGAKTEFFDRKLRANIALFQSNYKNLQIQALTFDKTGAPAYLFTNVGKARIRGAEFEVDAEPIDYLQINASLGYLDYETLDLGTAADVPNGPLKDAPPPLTPKWKYSIGAQYTFDLGHAGTLSPRIDYAYQSRVYNDQRGTRDISQAGYGLLNGRITYTTPDEKWQLTVQATNLTNKHYYYVVTDARTQTGLADGQTGDPRAYWISIRRQF